MDPMKGYLVIVKIMDQMLKYNFSSISEKLFLKLKYMHKEHNLYIESQKIIYNENTNTVFSKSETYINNVRDMLLNVSNSRFPSQA